MYERFTDRARKVMQFAEEEARRFNHEYVGTEHILLGLVKEGSGVGATVLKDHDINLRKVRRAVEEIVQSGTEPVTTVDLPRSPRARAVIKRSFEECRNLKHNYVGTEHLLLALLQEKWGVGFRVLTHLGLKGESVRAGVLRELGLPADLPPAPADQRLDVFPAAVASMELPDSERTEPTPARAGGRSGSPPAGAVEAGIAAGLHARVQWLERNLTTARFLFGCLAGAAAGFLVDDRLGAGVGLIVGGSVAQFGRTLPALLTGAVGGGLVGAGQGGGEVGTVVGAVLGALLASSILEVGCSMPPAAYGCDSPMARNGMRQPEQRRIA